MPVSDAAVSLAALFGAYPNTRALLDGRASSPLVRFDFAVARRAHEQFKAVVRAAQFDVAELAVVTFLQARERGVAYSLVPAVVVGRHQHRSLVYDPSRGRLAPGDLAGRRVGVRGYTQTAATWVRAILEEEHGVDWRRIHWVTFDAPHVEGYDEPPWVERIAPGASLAAMLRDGRIDAAIFGNDGPEEGLEPVIPDADAAAARWAARHGGIPINHMPVIRQSIVQGRPDLVREVYRLLRASRDVAAEDRDHRIWRFGVESLQRSLQTLIDISVRQGLIASPVAVDELFADAAKALVSAR